MKKISIILSAVALTLVACSISNQSEVKAPTLVKKVVEQEVKIAKTETKKEILSGLELEAFQNSISRLVKRASKSKRIRVIAATTL